MADRKRRIGIDDPSPRFCRRGTHNAAVDAADEVTSAQTSEVSYAYGTPNAHERALGPEPRRLYCGMERSRAHRSRDIRALLPALKVADTP